MAPPLKRLSKGRNEPERDGHGEDNEGFDLGALKWTEPGQLFRNLLALHRQSFDLGRKDPKKQEPGTGQHEDRGGHPVSHPFDERDLDAGQIFQITQSDGVGARPGRRGDAANERAEGTRDHQRPAEIALQALESGIFEQAHAQGQKDRGYGHVRYPHRKRRTGDQEP